MPDILNKYCSSLFNYKRNITREVSIGDIPLGGLNPIRIQSMTNTNTLDTGATVAQTLRMARAGCEYVRITAPSIKEAENLKEIKDELRRQGCLVPLIADIHYTPNAAETAARIVEKVRINPGNYADKKSFKSMSYSESEYEIELERIAQRVAPLINICKEYGTAIRIGVNHGSLSDRIMSRFGDTPAGMVESALEFLKILGDMNFHSIVLSMKSSNPQVMVQAYRLLVNKMQSLNMNYPLHIGVTEAGDGTDGRIKSAAGIGSLLEDGIGDTIRVSLTEAPEEEAPVAIILRDRYSSRLKHRPVEETIFHPVNPFSYSKRETFSVFNLGGSCLPRVFADLSEPGENTEKSISEAGYIFDKENNSWRPSDQAADFIYFGNQPAPEIFPKTANAVYNYDFWNSAGAPANSFPLFSFSDYKKTFENPGGFSKSEHLNFVLTSIENLNSLSLFKADHTAVPVITSNNPHGSGEIRRILYEMEKLSVKNPITLKYAYENISKEALTLYLSAEASVHLLDGFGDALWCRTDDINVSVITSVLFGILQSARLRISKTEYISCPSCGRTLFDLQQVTADIRKRTSHLKGLKIAVMGCIVNGPGEMADADYGYVGSGPGKVTLYKGKEILKRNLNSEVAVDELIALIKEDGNWKEPN